ncbi:hypothetical protein SAMN06297387_110123 [Streptomyces zhaozhouensis]|uniref:Uncharacterized protein n=1 Tax=Streptomyces zhaozhouensis TaxID=1300267 RepID=A0A286DXJ9_9ACTN|nr:hypothetical protein [Streptomyces zhaozhouensis]SOD63391.1 hypothetical protein SAMN06297387_110123 [Streptomyces zhaozhouensis]
MSHMQGWPGPAGAPGPSGGPQKADQGRRLGILALVVVLVTGLSFGLAAATGADARDNGAMGPAPGMGDMEGMNPEDMPELEGLEDLDDLESDIGGDGGDLGGESGDLGGDSGDLGGDDFGGDSGTTPTEEPTDPTLDLYRSVSAGDCLATWMTSETEWSSTTPEVVDCSAENAGVWVSATTGSLSDCPTDAGRSYIYYTSGAETVALCLTRQFEIGQCFLGSGTNANLMSWVDCEGGSVPSPYDRKFNVLAVYATSNNTGEECAAEAGTRQYYYWSMDGNSTLLCALEMN